MLYSIIYTVDCTRTANLLAFRPPRVRQDWTITERDEQFEYDYLGDAWEGGKHRKYCGVLDQDAFEAFLSHTDLIAQDCETMGALGTPAYGYGVAPAISFDASSTYDDPDDYGYILNAYVTPVPEDEREAAREWEDVRREIIRRYGS